VRNIFDQYTQPENRLTHALACCLEAEHSLLVSFVKWATGEDPPRTELSIVEQSLPGEPEPEESEQERPDAVRRSLPDAWIFSEDGWALLIESKVALNIDTDQLQRHLQTASRRGYESPLQVVLWLGNETPTLPERTKARTWSELYGWAKASTTSEWARRLARYMEVSEQKMLSDEYLKGGYTLTTFTGISFDTDNPYTYLAGKRLLQLAMQELRKSRALQEQLGVNVGRPGRPAITGSKGSHVWDVLQFSAADKREFSEFPHLTLGIEREQVRAQLTLPNGIDGQLRRRLAILGFSGLQAALSEFVQRAAPLLMRDPGATPYVLVLQRRYPSQRAEPFVDARVEFDPRTAVDAGYDDTVKLQEEWLEATVAAFSKRQANLNLSFGVAFKYGKSKSLGQASFISTVEDVWLATKPILVALGLAGELE